MSGSKGGPTAAGAESKKEPSSSLTEGARWITKFDALLLCPAAAPAGSSSPRRSEQERLDLTALTFRTAVPTLLYPTANSAAVSSARRLLSREDCSASSLLKAMGRRELTRLDTPERLGYGVCSERVYNK